MFSKIVKMLTPVERPQVTIGDRELTASELNSSRMVKADIAVTLVYSIENLNAETRKRIKVRECLTTNRYLMVEEIFHMISLPDETTLTGYKEYMRIADDIMGRTDRAISRFIGKVTIVHGSYLTTEEANSQREKLIEAIDNSKKTK